MCACVCREEEAVHVHHVGGRTWGWRERRIKTFEEKTILFVLTHSASPFLLWEAVWIVI